MNTPAWLKLSRRPEDWAIFFWGLLIVVVSAIVLNGKQGRLYPTFVNAGHQFRFGEPLYPLTYNIDDDKDLFRYSPLTAAVFVPFDFLPTQAGSILWRSGQAIFLLLMIRLWARIALPPVSWAWLAILALPLCGGNIHNAQVNPMVLALMLATLVAFHRDRYWLAAVAIVGAMALKGYPVCLAMLLLLVEPRRFPLPLVVSMLIAFAIPFLLQDREYVLQQYRDWFQVNQTDDRSARPLYDGYHNFQRLLLRYRIVISLSDYRIIEVLAGILMAGFVVWGQRMAGWSRHHTVHTIAGMSFVWVTLFGPATETATYILLAATVSHAVLVVLQRPWWERILVILCYLAIFTNVAANWFSPPISHPLRSLIPQAHGALGLLIWLIVDAVRAKSDT